MPHKHTRRTKDPSDFDLPPSQVAKPLPVDTISRRQTKQAGKADDTASQRGVKRKRGNLQKDDAPRAFKRLMAFAEGKKVKPGLDDGQQVKGKKQKKATQTVSLSEETTSASETPKIRPGERMSDFAARVDTALPLGGLINKTVKLGNDPLSLKVYRTKKERKLHKLYDQWRVEDQKVKEKREEDLELAEEREMENQALGIDWNLGARGKKGKNGKLSASQDDDPWGELKKKRGEMKIGLHDVVKAPPDFKKSGSKKLLIRGAEVEAGSIPKSAGSLSRREELQKFRDDVIASYRETVDRKRQR